MCKEVRSFYLIHFINKIKLNKRSFYKDAIGVVWIIEGGSKSKTGQEIIEDMRKK